MPRRGFTMLELALVLAVLVITAALAVPSIDALQGDFRLNAATDIVRGRWAEARARAIDDGVAYRFSVIPHTGKYRVMPDDEGSTPADGETKPLEMEDELPNGINFADGSEGGDDSGGEWATVAVFLPDGTARRDVEVGFHSSAARSLTLRLRSLTGAVTVIREGGGR